MKTDLVVAGYIFNEDKVLLIHHKKLDLWIPVGGHIDKDETPNEALLREVKEEVGIDVDILNKSDISLKGNIKNGLAAPFYVNVHSVGDHDHCCFFYICKLKNNKKIKINKEIKNFNWFTKKDLNKDYVPEDVRNIGIKAFELFRRLNK